MAPGLQNVQETPLGSAALEHLVLCVGHPSYDTVGRRREQRGPSHVANKYRPTSISIDYLWSQCIPYPLAGSSLPKQPSTKSHFLNLSVTFSPFCFKGAFGWLLLGTFCLCLTLFSFRTEQRPAYMPTGRHSPFHWARLCCGCEANTHSNKHKHTHKYSRS